MEKTVDARHITPETLALLGAEDTIYIKPVVENGVMVYAIHSAVGLPIAVVSSREQALAAAIQNDLTPATLH